MAPVWLAGPAKQDTTTLPLDDYFILFPFSINTCWCLFSWSLQHPRHVAARHWPQVPPQALPGATPPKLSCGAVPRLAYPGPGQPSQRKASKQPCAHRQAPPLLFQESLFLNRPSHFLPPNHSPPVPHVDGGLGATWGVDGGATRRGSDPQLVKPPRPGAAFQGAVLGEEPKSLCRFPSFPRLSIFCSVSSVSCT